MNKDSLSDKEKVSNLVKDVKDNMNSFKEIAESLVYISNMNSVLLDVINTLKRNNVVDNLKSGNVVDNLERNTVDEKSNTKEHNITFKLFFLHLTISTVWFIKFDKDAVLGIYRFFMYNPKNLYILNTLRRLILLIIPLIVTIYIVIKILLKF